MIESPLKFWGTGERRIRQLMTIWPDERQPDKFYDICCGSGSFTLYAMQANLAKNYVMIDACPNIINFWQQVKTNSTILNAEYAALYNEVVVLDETGANTRYEQILAQFNAVEWDNIPCNATHAAHYAFLINHAQGNEVKYDGIGRSARLNISLDFASLSEHGAGVPLANFTKNLDAAKKLFEDCLGEITIRQATIADIYSDVTPNDIVILDPPYPDLDIGEQANTNTVTYYRANIDRVQLKSSIEAVVDDFDQRGINFILFYGVYATDNSTDVYLECQDKAKHYLYFDPGWEYIGHVFFGNKLKLEPNYMAHTLKPLSAVEALNSSNACEKWREEVNNTSYYPYWPAYIEEQARVNAEGIALLKVGQKTTKTITFFELNKRANQLANYLIKELAHQNTIEFQTKPVAILTIDKVENFIAMLALLKIGRTYSIIDANGDQDLTIQHLQSVCPSAVIIDKTAQSCYGDSLGDISGLQTREIINVDDAKDAITSHPSFRPNKQIKLTNNAYIHFTSGSTGKPKGVAVANRALSYAYESHLEQLELSPNDAIAQMANFAFDACQMEFLCTGAGVTLVIADSELKKYSEAEYIKQWLGNHIKPATITILVPSVMSEYIHLNLHQELRSLRLVLTTGGRAYSSILQQFANVEVEVTNAETGQVSTLNTREIVNGYGLNETTIAFSMHRYMQENEVPIGKAAIKGSKCLYQIRKLGDNSLVPDGRGSLTRVYTASEVLARVEEDEFIELCAGGICVANYYVKQGRRDEELTQRKFFTTTDPETKELIWVHRTGDKVRIDDNGNIIHLGRFDGDIKIMGARYSIEHIEEIITQGLGISTNKIAVIGVHNERQDIVNVYIENSALQETQQLITPRTVMQSLQSDIKTKTVPLRVFTVANIPLTAAQKKNRKILPSLSPKWLAIANRTQASEDEQKIIEIFQQVLEIPSEHSIDVVEETYYSLGGSSLAKLRLFNKLRDAGFEFQQEMLAVDFSVRDLANLHQLNRIFANDAGYIVPVNAIDTNEIGINKPNVFVFHAIEGNCKSYDKISAKLGERYNVYHVNHPFSHDADISEDLQERLLNCELTFLADQYARAVIRQLKKHDINFDRHNVHFAGWSFGANLAILVAARLTQLGYQVGTLTIMDISLPAKLRHSVEVSFNPYNKADHSKDLYALNMALCKGFGIPFPDEQYGLQERDISNSPFKQQLKKWKRIQLNHLKTQEHAVQNRRTINIVYSLLMAQLEINKKKLGIISKQYSRYYNVERVLIVSSRDACRQSDTREYLDHILGSEVRSYYSNLTRDDVGHFGLVNKSDVIDQIIDNMSEHITHTGQLRDCISTINMRGREVTALANHPRFDRENSRIIDVTQVLPNQPNIWPDKRAKDQVKQHLSANPYLFYNPIMPSDPSRLRKLRKLLVQYRFHVDAIATSQDTQENSEALERIRVHILKKLDANPRLLEGNIQHGYTCFHYAAEYCDHALLVEIQLRLNKSQNKQQIISMIIPHWRPYVLLKRFPNNLSSALIVNHYLEKLNGLVANGFNINTPINQDNRVLIHQLYIDNMSVNLQQLTRVLVHLREHETMDYLRSDNQARTLIHEMIDHADIQGFNVIITQVPPGSVTREITDYAIQIYEDASGEAKMKINNIIIQLLEKLNSNDLYQIVMDDKYAEYAHIINQTIGRQQQRHARL